MTMVQEKEEKSSIPTCSVSESGFDYTGNGNKEFMELGITIPVGE
jgi:hypothetical protein